MFKLISLGFATVEALPTKIVAVGDSITEGACSSDEGTHSWPAQLHNILNDEDKYTVKNLGVSGRTMMKNGDFPYWNEQAYQDALNSEADILILMLGTNDSKP
jgi:acyl-CoA thioesterase I